MALLLAQIRKISLSNKLVQSGRWEMPAVVPIRRIEAEAFAGSEFQLTDRVRLTD